MATKVCSKCGEEKDVETGFYRVKNRRGEKNLTSFILQGML